MLACIPVPRTPNGLKTPVFQTRHPYPGLPMAIALVSVHAVEPRLLNIKQAAAYLSARVWFMRNLVWARRIPFVKFGKAYAFDRADLDAFVEAQKTVACTENK